MIQPTDLTDLDISTELEATYSIHLMTGSQPGAVAMIQMEGPAQFLDALILEVTKKNPQQGKICFCEIAELDHGLVVKLTDEVAQLMPHGGLRMVQRITDDVVQSAQAIAMQLGLKQTKSTTSAMTSATISATASATALAEAMSTPPWKLFPEARDRIEATMMLAMATASSSAAIDLLAHQPDLWREAWRSGLPIDAEYMPLNYLLTPPTVVVVGPPNVGKSTLMNRMTGRATSLVADLPGTTRDWVGGLVELQNGLAMRWLDTPGLRTSDDDVEQKAIELARQAIFEADVLIEMRSVDSEVRIDAGDLPREPDLEVVNKIDQSDARDKTSAAPPLEEINTLAISAKNNLGIDALEAAITEHLGLSVLLADSKEKSIPLWAFSPWIAHCQTSQG